MTKKKDYSTKSLSSNLRDALEMYYEKFNRMYNNEERTLFRLPGDCGFAELGDDCIYIDWMGFDGNPHYHFKVKIFDLIYQVNQEFLDNMLFRYLAWCKVTNDMNSDFDYMSQYWAFRIGVKIHNWLYSSWFNKWLKLKSIPSKVKIPSFVDWIAERENIVKKK